MPPLKACPRPLDNAKTLQDRRIQQLESELQHSQDNLRESTAQEQVHQNRITQLQSELQTSQNKVQEQVHQNEDLRRKVRQYEDERVAMRRAFQKQAEQLLFTSEIALPWDERMVARGLSPKLHWWQIPEIKAFASLCEDALTQLSEACAERAPMILSILALLARGVRGVEGLPIVREVVVSQKGLNILCSEACPQDISCKLSLGWYCG